MSPVRVSIDTVTGSPLSACAEPRRGPDPGCSKGRLHRQQPAVDVDVLLGLPPVAVQPLTEIALVVVQADGHERNAEIRRALEVIARQNAESAGVNRQRLVQAELRGEVRDRPRPQHTGVACAPGLLRAQVLLHPPVGVVDAAVEGELRRPLFQLVDGQLLQQRDRVVIELVPQQRIELAKQAGGFRVPGPPQVARERPQPLVRRGDELLEGPRLRHNRRQLRAGHDEHPDIVVAEQPRLDGLDHEDALQHAAIDDGHAEERSIRVLARFAEILEPRVQRRVGDDQRLQLFGHEAGEPLAEPHADAADAFGAKSDRRGEDQGGAIGLEQIHRADVGLEPRLNEVHDVRERFGGVAAPGGQPTDLLERPQQRSFAAGFCLVADHDAPRDSKITNLSIPTNTNRNVRRVGGLPAQVDGVGCWSDLCGIGLQPVRSPRLEPVRMKACRP